MSKLGEFSINEEVGKHEEKLAQYRSKIDQLQAALKRTTSERDEANHRLDFVGRLEAGEIKPPAWALTPKKSRGDYHGIVNLMLSDTHFDEVVVPAQVDWYNAYNREIAEGRLKRAIDSTIRISHEFFTGIKYDGMTLFLGGDIFSGNIHQDLRETNEAPILASVLHWENLMASAIERLATAYGKLHIPCTYGNHGRQNLKPIAKMRAQDSYEWIFYNHVAKHFASYPSITWQIPDAMDCLVKVYDHITLLTHGDQFRGGSGISGALAPLMLGTHRKTRRQAALGKPYHMMAMGHWHQLISIPGKGLLVNGTMKGYDEYAYQSNFEPEVAQQAFWITTPEHGVTFSAPIICQNRKAEGW
jgi:hypothetical protein